MVQRFWERVRVFFRSHETLIDVALILLIGCLSLTWFRGWNLIDIGDFGFPLWRPQFFYNTLFLWDGSLSLGYVASRQLAFLVPYSLYAGLTHLLGLSIEFFQRSLFYFWFTFSGLSMYYLCSVVGFKKVGRLAASLFYMMNPYALEIPWHLASGLLIAPYAASPIILGLFLKCLNCGKHWFKQVIILVIVWFFTATYAYANPATAIVHWVVILLYFFYFVMVNRRYSDLARRAIRILAVLGIFWIAVNSFWLVPFLSDVFNQRATASDASLGFISDLETFKLNSVKIVGSFRLTGVWSLHGGYRGAPYYVWAATHSTWPFILMSFLIPLFAFFPLLRRRKNQYYFFFAVLAIIGLFLTKGSCSPLGGVNIWLYKHIPLLLTAFRANVQKWGLVTALAFAPLVGGGINYVSDCLHERFGRKISFSFVLIIFILLFVIFAYPFRTGDVIFAGGREFPSARISIPDYYYQFREWTAKQSEDHRIFSLPMSRNSNAAYFWKDDSTGGVLNGYAGGDIIRWFSTKPVIYSNTVSSYSIPLLVGKEIEQSSTNPHLTKLFSLLNVRYILFHGDYYWEFFENHPWQFGHNPKNISTFLSSLDGVRLGEEFGELKLYKVTDKYFLPRIYAAETITYSEGDIESLPEVVSFDDFELKNGIFLADDVEFEQCEFVQKCVDDLFVKVPLNEKRDGSHFKFSASRPVTYDIFVQNDSGFKEVPQRSMIVFEMDGKQAISSEKHSMGVSGNWLRLGKVSVKEGSHRGNIRILYPSGREKRIGKAFVALRVVDAAESTGPKVVFKRINPTKYKVSVDAAGSYMLIFSESFNPGWRAYVDRKLVSEERHLLVNGYANAWYIDKTGKHNIILYFWPQNLFYIGLVISGVTLLLCSVYLVWDWRKKATDS